MSFAEQVFWNSQSYGKAVRVKRTTAMVVLGFVLLVLPLMNWAIPFVGKIVRNDLVWRYE